MDTHIYNCYLYCLKRMFNLKLLQRWLLVFGPILGASMLATYFLGFIIEFILTKPLAAVAAFYFLIGLFSAFLCVGVAFRPSFFRAKGALNGLPYPVWTSNNPRLKFGSNNKSILSLIPVQSLLSFGERHLISHYKYIQVVIGGITYFFSLDEWVPLSMTYIIRDKQSGSLIGIPKIDGYG